LFLILFYYILENSKRQKKTIGKKEWKLKNNRSTFKQGFLESAKNFF